MNMVCSISFMNDTMQCAIVFFFETFSMDDLKASPNAGHVIVQASLDTAIDCKEADREAIIAILSIRTGIIN